MCELIFGIKDISEGHHIVKSTKQSDNVIVVRGPRTNFNNYFNFQLVHTRI